MIDLDAEIELYKSKVAFYENQNTRGEYAVTVRELKYVVETLKAVRTELQERRETDTWNTIESKEDNPKAEGFYLTTVENYSELEGKMKYTTAENYFTPDFGGQWVDCDDDESSNIIAWKPLPKPYGSEAENE